MADLDEIFRTSVELAHRHPDERLESRADPFDEAAPEGPVPGHEHREPPADRRRSTPDPAADDPLIDIGALVTSWNAEHGAGGTSARAGGGRRRRAREVLADHIGSHPTVRVEPPVPPDLGPSGDIDPCSEVEPAPEVEPRSETEDTEGMSPTRPDRSAVARARPVARSRRERNAARREVDRLQRECARNPADIPAVTGDVRLVGAVPSSPEALGPELPTRSRPDPIRLRDVPAPGSTLPVVEGEPTTLDDSFASAEEHADPAPITRGQRRAQRRGGVRFPILTRSVTVWLFIFMVAGAAFGASAAFWWSHFNAEVDAIRLETSAFVEQAQGAAATLEAQRANALDEIDGAMEPLARLAQDGLAPTVAAQVASSVLFVETLDEEGVASVGSAFVVGSADDTSLLLTSLDVVASGTTAPGPDITVHDGDQAWPADLWAWDVELDLALLIVEVPDLPVLEWASDDAAARAVGSGVFVAGGLGGAGATAIPGLVVDQSAVGFQHTAAVGAAYRGGPVLTNDGKVLGVASLGYQPLAFDPGDVHFSIPVARACGAVLECGMGGPRAAESGSTEGSRVEEPSQGTEPEATG